MRGIVAGTRRQIGIMSFHVVLFAAACLAWGESNYYVDPAARITLADGPDHERSGDLDGGMAAWYNSVLGLVYVQDLEDPDSPARPIVTAGKPSRVRISGDYVVWYDHAQNNHHVYACDISQPTLTPMRLSSAASSENMLPAVSGNMVVWKDNRVDPAYSDIWGFDLSDPGRGDFLIVEGIKWGMEYTGRPNPNISGDWLVWFQEPAMPPEPHMPTCEIKALDLGDPGAAPITLDVGYAVGIPHIDGRTVVYNVSRDWTNWDIAGFDLGDIAAGPFPVSDTGFDETVRDMSGDLVLYGSGEYPEALRLVDLADMSEHEIDLGGDAWNYVALSRDWIMWSQDGDLYANRILPEPATLGMFAFGALALLRRGRKR